MNRSPRICYWGALLSFVAVVAYGALARAGEPNLPHYTTKYYILYSDLDLDTLREAAVRLDAMAEEYHRRTKDFSKSINKRFPVYLFSKNEDYHSAGGVEGSVGMYLWRGRSGKLLVSVEGWRRLHLWHVLKHEGFHQFAHMTITPKLPVWVNEGLAEYFAGGVWTGDRFITGLISPEHLMQVKETIHNGDLKDFNQFMAMSNEEWTDSLDYQNYDQAWAMVHFLIHGDDGRYRKAFAAFINDLSRGRGYKQSWVKRFGRDIAGFQEQFEKWWLSLPDNPTEALDAEAVTATLTSYLARAYQQGLRFGTAEEFFDAASQGKIKCGTSIDNYLPPTLLKSALLKRKQYAKWSLDAPKGRQPKLLLTLDDGTTLTGTFTIRRKRRPGVKVSIEKPSEKPAKKQKS